MQGIGPAELSRLTKQAVKLIRVMGAYQVEYHSKVFDRRYAQHLAQGTKILMKHPRLYICARYAWYSAKVVTSVSEIFQMGVHFEKSYRNTSYLTCL
jgi:hypothetical protein